MSINLEQARFNMVEQQIRTWDVLDQDVLDLLYAIHREEFVPPPYRDLAFADMEIPLPAGGQHMWQPKMEARVLQSLAIRKQETVLEIGTGSGYLCALMARRARQVVSVEIEPKLLAFGESNLRNQGIRNVVLELGDAARGWSHHGPYDVIVLTGSSPVIPEALFEQLAPGGRLFAVVGDPPVMAARLFSCESSLARKSADLFETCLAPLSNATQPVRFQF